MPNTRVSKKVSKEAEVKKHASGLTRKELNKLIDDLMDSGKFEEASMYAMVYVRRT